MQKLEKRWQERQEERKVSSYWNKSCLIHSKNFNTEANTPNKSTQRNPIQQKKRNSVWNLIQWQEFWIHLTKFDATTRKLNRFSAWYVATKCDMARRKLHFCVDSASYLIAVMLHECITYGINMTLCGEWVLQKVDINLLVLHEAL